MSRLPNDTPIQAVAEHGVVLLDGPEGLAASLTPDAARKSAQRMSWAADVAEQEPDAETP